MPYVRALRGDQFILDVFDSIFDYSRDATDMRHAALTCITDKLKNDELLSECMVYEGIIKQFPNATVASVVFENNDEISIKMKTQYDMPNLFESLSYYERTKAPAFIYQALIPERQTNYIVVSQKASNEN